MKSSFLGNGPRIKLILEKDPFCPWASALTFGLFLVLHQWLGDHLSNGRPVTLEFSGIHWTPRRLGKLPRYGYIVVLLLADQEGLGSYYLLSLGSVRRYILDNHLEDIGRLNPVLGCSAIYLSFIRGIQIILLEEDED